MQKVLDSQLAAALAQPLCISTDVSEEANENLYCLKIAESELSSCTIQVIEEWLEAVVAGKRQQLPQQQGSYYAMQFYSWHDAQATQLRFSLVSAAAALPFRCSLQLVELSVVVQEFLTQEHLLFDVNLFKPNSAAAQPATAQAAAKEFMLPVWRTIIS